MELIICNKNFKTEDIEDLRVTDKEVFITLADDFVRLKYKKEEDIQDALLYLKLQDITYQDIFEAMQILIGVCDVYINSKTQCITCPLNKKHGCILQTIPINWKGEK